MTLDGVDHLYVECSDFDRSLRFWRTLGFELVESWGEKGHRAGRIATGTATIVLAEGGTAGPTPHFRSAHLDHLEEALRAEDPSWIAAGVEPTHWGTRWLQLTDPDGRRFVIEDI